MRTLIVVGAVLAATGCGLGWTGDSSGGGANLPTLGAGPYGRLSADFETPAAEPSVVADRFESYADPACRHRDDGGLRVWFGMVRDSDPPGTSAIGLAEVPSLQDLPDVPPAVVLAAGEAWEDGWIGAPAVIEVGGALVMFYQGGGVTPAIGRAESTDGGATWSRRREPVLADAAAPTATHVDGRFHLFVTRPGVAGIWHATSADGLGFALDPDPAIVSRPDLDGAFDAALVADPFVLVQTSDAGRHHWGLWFTGAAAVRDPGPTPTAIGYAGSFDGRSWERFGGAEPVLTAPAGGPCVLLDGGAGILLFHEERRLHLGVSAAVHP